jgi:hypothetical protein
MMKISGLQCPNSGKGTSFRSESKLFTHLDVGNVNVDQVGETVDDVL